MLSILTVCAALGFVVIGTTAAFAHTNTVVGVQSCNALGKPVITWTITNDFGTNDVASVDNAAYDPNGITSESAVPTPSGSVLSTTPSDTPAAGLPAGALGFTIGDDGTATVTQVLPTSYTGQVIIYVHGSWADGYVSSPSANPPSSDAEGITSFRFSCTVTTTHSSISGTQVLGTTGYATDVATVTGHLQDGYQVVNPTGPVNFYDCYSSTPISTCSLSGAPLNPPGTSSTLVPVGNGVSTATSPSLPVNQVGYYCFFASYGQDDNYLPSSDTNSTNECFQITPATPVIASAPTSNPITFGGSNTDKVTVTGIAGVAPTGTVTFFECAETTAGSACTSGGTAVPGTPTYATSGAVLTATSPSVTPSAAGNYCFYGTYSGDSNYVSVSDGGTTECFVVTSVTTTTTVPPTTTTTTVPPTTTTTTVPPTTTTTTISPATAPAASTPTRTVATAAATAKKTTPAVAASSTTPVPGATAVHTGKPWSGSGPYALVLGGLGVLLIGFAEMLRRRRHA